MWLFFFWVPGFQQGAILDASSRVLAWIFPLGVLVWMFPLGVLSGMLLLGGANRDASSGSASVNCFLLGY